MPYYEIVDTLPPPPVGAGEKTYKALITQTGTDAPTAAEFSNNTITGLTYTYEGVGAYAIHCTGAFANQTLILLGPNRGSFRPYIRCYRNSDDQLTLESYKGTDGNAEDSIITDLNFQIITYP